MADYGSVFPINAISRMLNYTRSQYNSTAQQFSFQINQQSAAEFSGRTCRQALWQQKKSWRQHSADGKEMKKRLPLIMPSSPQHQRMPREAENYGN